MLGLRENGRILAILFAILRNLTMVGHLTFERPRRRVVFVGGVSSTVSSCASYNGLRLDLLPNDLNVIGHEFGDVCPNGSRLLLDLVCKIVNIPLGFVNEIVDVACVLCYCCDNLV